MIESHVFTLKELGVYLRVHPSTIYRAIKQGTAPPYFKIGSDYRFNRESVDRWRLSVEQGKP